MPKGLSTSDVDKGAKRIRKDMNKLDSAYVTVGVHEGAGAYPSGVPVATVAFWNEFGTRSAPARPFFRSAIDEKINDIISYIDEMRAEIINGKCTPKHALEKIGFYVQEIIKAKILSNVPPPNAPGTLARKAGTKTLVDSRLLLRSIAFEVHE